jgi:excisionase family DNA binding protein
MTKVNERYFTSKEAAGMLGVTTRTIQLWSESGVLKAWKTAGGHRRFNQIDIEKVMSQLTQEVNEIADEKSLHILIIEDDDDLINLYKMTISQWDLPIILETAKDGFEALIQLGACKPDIVITDIKMPNIDGIQMLKTLAKMKLFSELTIIAVSGLSKAEVDQKGGLPEGIPLFEKPIPFDKIEKIVNQHYKKLRNR